MTPTKFQVIIFTNVEKTHTPPNQGPTGGGLLMPFTFSFRAKVLEGKFERDIFLNFQTLFLDLFALRDQSFLVSPYSYQPFQPTLVYL